MLRKTLCLLGTAALLGTSVPAQLGKFLAIPNNNNSHKIDAQKLISTAMNKTFNGCLGVAYDWLRGVYYVSARRSPPQVGNPHMLFKIWYDRAKKAWQVKGFPAPAVTAASSWGLRDLVFDGRFIIYGSAENGATQFTVFAFNVLTSKFDPTFDYKVPTNSPASTTRALALNPVTKTMWTTNFSSPHVEFDRTGKLVKTVPSIQASVYGGAYDPVRKTVWWFAQRIAVGNNSIRVVGTEMDPVTGKATGTRFAGDLSIPGSVPGGIAGGCEFYTRRDGTPVLLLLTQAASDTIYEIYGRFQYGKASDGELAMNGEIPRNGNLKFGVELRNSKAALALLILGTTKVSVPLTVPGFAPGSLLLVAPPNILYGVPVANGLARLPIPLPANPALAGINTWWQIAGVHTSGPFKVSMANGGETKIY